MSFKLIILCIVLAINSIAGVPRRKFVVFDNGDGDVFLDDKYYGDLLGQKFNKLGGFGYPQYNPITGNQFYPYVSNPSLFDPYDLYLSNGGRLTGLYGQPQYQIYPVYPLKNDGNNNNYQISSFDVPDFASANGLGDIVGGLTNTVGNLLGGTPAAAPVAGTINPAAGFLGGLGLGRR
ncbi:hypothetical protein PVAND_015948 [Polypedilum vanderplanki]|uniref:Secreted protein n=1 Tax=Polypedilum vanderplanki TaxID=319348 RepID=A0A9J6BEF2_POLVA|nr:hypothetical protein PVAND_015948 [Polypedilum vanderplanki]